MRGYKNTTSRDYAVSEVIGAMLLVLIAVAAFSAIYFYIIPEGPDINPSVEIYGEVTNDGRIALEHKGGTPLTDYKIIVRYHENNTLLGSKIINDDYWQINQYRYPLQMLGLSDIKLVDTSIVLNIMVYCINSDGSYDEVFNHVMTGTVPNIPILQYTGDLMLISSLRTNTTSEDIICFNKTINSSINASTYIYSWRLNGLPLAQFLMPFNTNNSTITRDYSGYGNDGLVRDCVWVEEGVVGGAYRFGGSKEYVVIEANLSECFEDLYRNSFTISIWVNCSKMEDDNKIILEVRKDTLNFVRLFQQDDAFHLGVCVDGEKYTIKTSPCVSNEWYHLAAVWNPAESDSSIYLDGVECTTTSSASFSCGAHTGISLGHGNAGSGGYWYGLLDEVQIYDRVLSEDQICQIYLTQKTGQTDKEVLVASELNEGEIWQCIVTPNDGLQDDTPVVSNPLQIIEYGGRD